jgi:hypothetical protein
MDVAGERGRFADETRSILCAADNGHVAFNGRFVRKQVVPSWSRCKNVKWVDGAFSKYHLIRQRKVHHTSSFVQLTCIRKNGGITPRCSACAYRHRKSNPVCLANIPGSKTPLEHSKLYGLNDNCNPLFAVHRTSSIEQRGDRELVVLTVSPI